MATVDFTSLPPNNQSPAAQSASKPKPEQEQKRMEKMFDVKPEKKKSKFASVFVQGTVDDAKDYILKSGLPSLRDWLWENAIRTLEMFVFKEARYRGGFPGKDNRNYDRAGYYDYSTKPKRDQASRPATNTLRFDFGDIRFYSESDAVNCLRKMERLAEEQTDVSLGQLLDMVGRFPEYTDWNWVWNLDDLRRSYPKAVSGGDWIIIFPEPHCKKH